ncbi:MAG: sigma-70 family RNA polymerase sigma factor [Alphaproteobacteria bacterium]
MTKSYPEQTPPINLVIQQHEAMVRRVAHHLHGRVNAVVEIEDLMQVGLTGLVEAAQRYTPQEGVSFGSYAVLRVRGAMLDYLRSNSNLCRRSIKMQQETRAAADRLRNKLQREATQEEIARELNLNEIDFANWQGVFAANFHKSIDEVYDEYSLLFASDHESAETTIDRARARDMLRDALATLPEREALVLQLYYVEELNIYDIAAILDVTPGRVSQIKSNAFKRLQGDLGLAFEAIS